MELINIIMTKLWLIRERDLIFNIDHLARLKMNLSRWSILLCCPLLFIGARGHCALHVALFRALYLHLHVLCLTTWLIFFALSSCPSFVVLPLSQN